MSNPDLSASITSVAAVVDRAMSDPAFRQQLLASPAATLQSAGVEVPQGVEVRALENSGSLANLVLQARPPGVSDDAIRQALEALGNTNSPAANLEAYARLVLQTWSDDALKSKLLADPAQVLAEQGITVPAGLKVRVLEASEQLTYLTLPAGGTQIPTSGADANLANVVTATSVADANLAKLVTATSYIAGLAFSASAIFKFKAHKDNPTQIPIGTPIALMVISAAALVAPTIATTTGK